VIGLRRRLLLCAALCPLAPRAGAADVSYPPVLHKALAFPQDHGAHPDYRIEWWYLTGVLDPPKGGQLPLVGIQLTFFRMRTPIAPENPSRFAAHQIILAHAAIGDPSVGSLLHEERIARAGFGVAQASTGDTGLAVDRWSLDRDARTGAYSGHVPAGQFTLEIRATPTQAALLQGEDGYSRKEGEVENGKRAQAASMYYSQPQLALQVRMVRDGAVQTRTGRGWLDHEWSSTLLPAHASGWDWGGFNLDDGSSLTVFRVRDGSDAEASSFAYACLRGPGRPAIEFAGTQVRFTPLGLWTSPRTRARYPVHQRIAVGPRTFEVEALMADQEFDARSSSGVVYWEGASTLREHGQTVGRGYLELTGYAGPMLGMR